MFPTMPFDLPWLGVSLPMPAFAPTPRSLGEAYAWLAESTVERMQANGARSARIPQRFAQRTSSNGKFQLSAQAWDLRAKGPTFAQLRLVKIEALRSHIINAWIFPADPTTQPVFAAELIGVAEVTRVAFLDIQTPAMINEFACDVSVVTSPLAARFSDLPCDEAAPDWATDQSTGNYTYARGADAGHLGRICDCYLAYLDCYLSLAKCSQPSTCTTPTALELLHAYQLHHMEHSPGKKFLSNLFEAEWTESFMHEFLFAQPCFDHSSGSD